MRIPHLSSLICALGAVVSLPTALARPVDGDETQLLPRANSDFPNPNSDPFYQQSPVNLQSASNGQVLKKREFPSRISSPHLNSTYHLYYKTSDTFLASQPGIASIFVPKEPASPARVLSVQYFEDSVSFDCAPSWALVSGSGSGSAVESYLDPGIYTQWALQKGYYVVSSDHEGPKAAFIAGFQEGRTILDGIRAIIADQGLGSDTQVAMVGYSGGAHATVWAETLAEDYAPELNFVGSVHGGTPIDPKGTLDLVNGGLTAGFAFAGLIGLANIYPELNAFVESIITPAGVDKFNMFKSSGYCIGPVATGSAFQNIFDYTTDKNALENPIAVKVLKAESLLQSYSSNKVPVPKFPRYLFHGLLDGIVPYADEKQYVQEQCSQGADIKFNTIVVSEHILGELLGIPGAILFLDQAFTNQIPKVKCGTILPEYQTPINSSKADDIMGKDLADQVRAMNGKSSPYGGTISF